MIQRVLLMGLLGSAPMMALEAGAPVAGVTPSDEARGGPALRHASPLWHVQLPLERPRAAATSGVSILGVTPSASMVQAFQRIEFQVSLSATIALPYETDPTQGGLDLQATVTAPSGALWQVAGFYDGTTVPGIWKVRFAPDEESTTPWQVQVSARSSTSTSLLSARFLCQGPATGAASHGWARIQSTGLQFSNDGSWFWGLGHNTGWQAQVETPTAAVMAAHGENLLSFWMAEPWELATDGIPAHAARAPLETADVGIGVYNQDACAYLDGVVTDAEASGIYLLPTLWAHDEAQDASAPFGNGSWSNNAYSLVCSGPSDFFTLATSLGQPTTSWHYQQNRYRYIAARWGYSTSIIGWVGMDEIDGTVGARLPQCQSWCTGVRQAMAMWDPYRTARSGAYPLVVTKTDTTSADAATWASYLDLKACDSYASDASTAAISTTIASETSTMLALGKPCFHGEFGAALTSGTASTVSQPDHLRHGIMAGMTAGAAWSPLLWTDGGEFPLVGDGSSMGSSLLDQYLRIAQFAAGIPGLGDPAWVAMPLRYSTAALQGRGRLAPAGDAGFLWLYAAQPLSTLIHPQFTISGVAPGSYLVTWCDVATGTAMAPITVSSTTVATGLSITNDLVVMIPASASSDLAVRFASPVASTGSTTGPGTGSGSSAAGTGTGGSGSSASTTTGTATGSGSTSATTTAGSSGSSSPSDGSHHCGLGLAGVSLLLAATLRHRRGRHHAEVRR